MAGEPTDTKTFDSQESYVVEGVPVVLQQEIGQATVKLKSGSPSENTKAVDAPNGVVFKQSLELRRGLAIYQFQTNMSLLNASASADAISSLNSDANVHYAYPVYFNPNTGNRIFLNDEVVMKLKTHGMARNTNITQRFKLKIVNCLNKDENIYVFRFTDPKDFNPFRVCNVVRALQGVVWAEPNIAQEVKQFVIPNDTLFSSQWHLRNTGQSGGNSDADVDADDAWGGSQGYGSPGVRIAIIDDGVQTTHPDLSGNVVQGFDFYSGDMDPNPNGTYNNHGTAVAGVAAAVVNNSAGVAGVAGKSQILPIRLLNTYDANGSALLPDAATVYRALVYAANNADIINCSWGGLSPNSTISAGFSFASGHPVFCSSGNGASGWFTHTLSGFPANTYTFDWLYNKDASGSAGDDTAWLDSVVFPGGSVEQFEGASLPSGWTTSPGSAGSWSSVQDGVGGNHALIAWNGEGSRSIRPGAIGNGQYSGVRVTKSVGSGDLTFRIWTSSESGKDGWRLYVNGSPQVLSGSGVPILTTDVSYPASLSSVFAVGATSDFDYRADFSQYGSTLAFVAPGGGGSGGIATTDRTGTDGYASGDYNTSFGGTSASAPLAAGIAALVLSKDGNQSVSTVLTKLKSTCDKVGSVAYSGTPYTRNDYYGYGRLNVYAAVNAVTADTTAPAFEGGWTLNHRAIDVTFSEPMGEGALNTANYSVTAGQGTLSSHPDKVVRLKYNLRGYRVYRLIWNSGSMAESGTVTIQASSSIKDVAGNALSGTLSRNVTSTKRVLAINCGDEDYFSFYTPPFIGDSSFQGNEYTPFLTTSTPSFFNDEHTIDGAEDAPVFYSQRKSWDYSQSIPIIYTLPNMPSGNLTVRLLFAEIDEYLASYQYFDIYINGSLVWSDFNIYQYADTRMYTACALEFPNITRDGSNNITVSLIPQEGQEGYAAAINGIEIVKP